MSNLLATMRAIDVATRAGVRGKEAGYVLQEEFVRSGVKFAASPQGLEDVYYAAVDKLADCVKTDAQGNAILQEGGIYFGCWLESTGTINAELLARFAPETAQSTFAQFARLQREDGLLPYKVTAEGAVFKQIQLVTPLARCAWNHYKLNGRDRLFLTQMYEALAKYDDWLALYRDTRGTGCVEAFCAYDTGHDLSPRFWHIPDTPYMDDPKRYDPAVPSLPLLAPDLTASVYCGRKYLAKMAAELGHEDAAIAWEQKAQRTHESLLEHCFHEEDGFFYDVDRHNAFVRIQSDVLLRVLACEVGDDALFAAALKRYLLNTRKFFAKYPLTSIAIDDPRFDPFSSYNTWAGAVNFLSLIRAPQAFERHGRYVELTWILQPIVSAISRMKRFGQCLSPWTGEEGFTETYSPAILCVLDYIERLCGIVPTPEGELWFTALLPQTRDHGVKLADETAYTRNVDGVRFELHNTHSMCAIYREGELLCEFPAGVRVVTDRVGKIRKAIGMSVQMVEGRLVQGGVELPLRIAGNEVLRLQDGRFEVESAPGVVMPTYE
ncbi:hypothetical protein DFQ01_11482 [Paenibacillus cellulosilyticus]|uniref:Mannosylglycerate hydrolase MGH1-like glycoside hydrolase domain-containing protein n=1 Tax=Paenibacillus cellulosilyticus TaxID=375489 RepID=A0A2V2YS68_9BACL|nr:hypothetical protein [Paenibacillus cellulosilyticus]PWV99505.1 hypothetical protein DFQ01_11482 [Paenibacillus cellulosilyticus]QKS44758.1 hypothetical protein HUB94_10290 [Paenibacillus cellulosilyticus]